MADKIKQLSDLDAQTLDGKTAIEIGVPAGTVISVAMNNIPDGFLECNGAEISRTTYTNLYNAIGETYGSGDGSTTFNLPDLRGEFLRGWDDGRGVDANRAFGSWQADEFREHNHTFNAPLYQGRGTDGNPGIVAGQEKTGNYVINKTGGSETRPRNVAMMYVIKY